MHHTWCQRTLFSRFKGQDPVFAGILHCFTPVFPDASLCLNVWPLLTCRPLLLLAPPAHHSRRKHRHCSRWRNYTLFYFQKERVEKHCCGRSRCFCKETERHRHRVFRGPRRPPAPPRVQTRHAQNEIPLLSLGINTSTYAKICLSQKRQRRQPRPRPTP